MGSTFVVDLTIFKKGNRPEDKYFDYQVNFGDGVIQFIPTEVSGDPKTLNCTSMKYSPLEKQFERDYVDIKVNKFHVHYQSIRLTFKEKDSMNSFIDFYNFFIEAYKNQMTSETDKEIKVESRVESSNVRPLVPVEEFLVNLIFVNKEGTKEEKNNYRVRFGDTYIKFIGPHEEGTVSSSQMLYEPLGKIKRREWVFY
uniref:CUB domain-containing protein n=3 Tax=Caenorhabditis tropicalis TaxID=1561998 RepID=A0A1I7TT33_9PELO